VASSYQVSEWNVLRSCRLADLRWHCIDCLVRYASIDAITLNCEDKAEAFASIYSSTIVLRNRCLWVNRIDSNISRSGNRNLELLSCWIKWEPRGLNNEYSCFRKSMRVCIREHAVSILRNREGQSLQQALIKRVRCIESLRVDCERTNLTSNYYVKTVSLLRNISSKICRIYNKSKCFCS
jgi:hypothetical protein